MEYIISAAKRAKQREEHPSWSVRERLAAHARVAPAVNPWLLPAEAGGEPLGTGEFSGEVTE